MMWAFLIVSVGLVIGSASIIYYKVPLEKKEELVKTVNIVGLLVTAASLFWAAYTYFDNLNRQNALEATRIYQEHMKITMDDRNKDFLGSADLHK